MTDRAGNAGGGARSDNTIILRRLIERDSQATAAGRIWKPVAVRRCLDAGEGASFPPRSSGKIGPSSGVPVDAAVTVTTLNRDRRHSFAPTQVPVGDRATIRIGGIQIVLTSNRTQSLGLELPRHLGIELTDQKPLLVMLTNHVMAAFGPVAAKVIDVDPDGSLSRDYRKIPYTRVFHPTWPLDAETTPDLIA